MRIITNNHTLLEMARVGNFNTCEVLIYSGEGNIPHFHLRDIQSNSKCCIRIDKAEYFNHGQPKQYTLKLNSGEKKDLIAFLNSSSDVYKTLNIELSIFRNIVVLWNQNNPEHPLQSDIEMPDYTKLN